MSIWDDAGAFIDTAFAEPEPLIYTGAGLIAQPIFAIRAEVPAPEFSGGGHTLRTIRYEVRQSDLPLIPSKSDTFTHRASSWRVIDITRRDDIGKWELIVSEDDFE